MFDVDEEQVRSVPYRTSSGSKSGLKCDFCEREGISHIFCIVRSEWIARYPIEQTDSKGFNEIFGLGKGNIRENFIKETFSWLGRFCSVTSQMRAEKGTR
jgi:hypothetical protein